MIYIWFIFHFNPLPPYGGRHKSGKIFFVQCCISIHSLRMEGDVHDIIFSLHDCISIHSLRMEGDQITMTHIPTRRNFNPLPPYGGRLNSPWRLASHESFQSTPSVWRETGSFFHLFCLWIFQSTPSVWRETIILVTHVKVYFVFQSTPSVWRETSKWLTVQMVIHYFNPLPPYGGRRCSSISGGVFVYISIHSLRMEGDVCTFHWLSCYYISIHSLRMEGDHLFVWVKRYLSTFQSTPSVWRETDNWDADQMEMFDFNPLPPYGGRPYCHFFTHSIRHFNPLPPYGGRLAEVYFCLWLWYFNPLPPYGGRLETKYIIVNVFLISIHSLRMEGDRFKEFICLDHHISIHSLRMEGD